jgi:carboxylesterase type B
VLLVNLVCAASSIAPVVNTDCGKVRGRIEGNLTVFKGIPYAKAPLDALRWMPPTRSSWGKTLDAANYGEGCMQYTGPQPNTGSEDCLSMNVWTPTGATEPLPVLFFLHGGDMTQGKSGWYDLALLAAQGPVVTVSINYRLNVFGFLAMPELEKRDPRPSSGNLGLLDQQFALAWVQRNAAAFNIDPKRVTLFGQSSGGTAILALLASPGSRGLFSGAISLSGSPNVTASRASAETQNHAFVDRLNCSKGATRADCLLQAPPQELLRACDWTEDIGDIPLHAGGIPQKNLSAICIVDGVTVVDELTKAYTTPVVDVPVIFQAMMQEGDLGPSRIVYNMTAGEFKGELTKQYSAANGWSATQISTLPKGIMAHYGADIAVNPQKAVASIIADVGVICGTLELAKAASAAFKSEVYVSVVQAAPSHPFYMFDQDYPMHYAGHLYDLIAATGDWHSPMFAKGIPWDPQEDDLVFGARMRQLWYEFARTGRLATKSTGFVPFRSAAPFAVGVVGTHATRVEHGWKNDICSWWAQNGVGKGFWWAD